MAGEFNMDAIVVELATSLNRFRSLTDDESNWLEQALRREGMGPRRLAGR
jgi:hypothetical protein